jgi:hypothetical protein
VADAEPCAHHSRRKLHFMNPRRWRPRWWSKLRSAARKATAPRASPAPTSIYGLLVRKQRDGPPKRRGRPRLEERDGLKSSPTAIDKPRQSCPPTPSPQVLWRRTT